MNNQLSGAYWIVNKVNGKKYVGSSIDIHKRLRQHRFALRRGNHPNSHLQASWDKYGEQSFKLEVAHLCDPDRCTEVEQELIDGCASYDPSKGYNNCPVAGSTLGRSHTEETKRKIAAAKIGKKLSKATRSLMSKQRRGVKHSRAHQDAVNKSLRKPEVRAKISLARRTKGTTPRCAQCNRYLRRPRTKFCSVSCCTKYRNDS